MYYWVWIVIASALLICELFTLTFYLLIVSIAFFATGLVSLFFHTNTNTNLAIASVLSLIGIVVVRMIRKKINSQRTTEMDHDIGNIVDIIIMDQTGLGTVRYRGTQWQAQLNNDCNPANHNDMADQKAKIVSKTGNILKIELIHN